MCLSPVCVALPPGSKNYHHVPCGKCIECLERRRNDWSLRLQQELKSSKDGYCYFLTLTYNPENVPCVIEDDELLGYTLDKKEFRTFVRALRDKLRYELKKCGYDIPLRYFACGEYGHTGLRPHYHMMLFNFPFDMSTTENLISCLWSKGFIQIGYLHDGGCHYQAKYMIKPSGLPDGCERPFNICSNGLGKGYLDKATVKYHRDNENVLLCSHNAARLPRYYRERIWSHDEREKLRNTLVKRFQDAEFKAIERHGSIRNWEYNRRAYYSSKEQKLFKSLKNKPL